MSTEKRDFVHAPAPAEAPPPYTEVEEGNAVPADRMAATDYYQSHPQNALQQAPAIPPQQHYPPPAQPQNVYPPPPQHQNSYPPPPPPPPLQQTNSYPPPRPHSNSLPPPPQNGYPQGPPAQGYPAPAPQPAYPQSPPYPTAPGQQHQPYTQNGWNPSWGSHPHSKPYQSPTPGQQGPNLVHAKPQVTFATPPPSQAHPQGQYPPVPQMQMFGPPRPPVQNGSPAAPILPSRRYSEPPDERKYRPDRRDDRYDDRRDRRDDRERDRDGNRRERHHKDKSKDHSNRNTFLGAGGGALIGDAIFPGLGTLGGLLLGGYAGHSHGRSKSSTGYRSGGGGGEGGRRSYEEDWEEGKRRRDRDRDRY